MNTYTIPLAEMDNVRNFVNKCNRRLARGGSMDEFTLVEEETKTIKYENEFIPVVIVSLNTPTIKAGEYEFVAAIDILDGGTVLRTPNGVNSDNFPRPTEHNCDHCGINRKRKYSFLLKHTTTGEFFQIGKSCLKVFTGVTPALWAFEIGFDRFELNDSNKKEYAVPMYDVDTVISVSYVVSDGGKRYVSTNKSWDTGENTTASTVRLVLDAMKGFFSSHMSAEEKAEITNLINEANKLPQSTIEEVKEISKNLDGSYGENLRVVINSEMITDKHVSIAASSVSAYRRELEKNAKKEFVEKNMKDIDSELTLVKEKFPVEDKVTGIDVTVTVARNYLRDSYNGYDVDKVALLVFTDNDGNNFVWHSTAKKAFALEVGQNVNITATVKDHKIYNAVVQTVITRAKIA